MNILIVDDEIYIVRTLKARLHWADIGIDEVFTALNVQRAKEIIQQNKIDILMTDIEMPQATGLELMQWVSENGYHPVGLCLTCHADFQYAQEALSLGFSEYILKPVNFQQLEETIKRLVERAKENEQALLRSEGGLLWERWGNEVQAGFWQKLIRGKAGKTHEEVVGLARRSGVEYHYDEAYGLLLFMICSEGNGTEWDQDVSLLQYAVHNILSETLLSFAFPDRLFWEDQLLWLVMEQEQMEEIRDNLEEALDTVRKMLGVGLACYAGEYVFGETLWEQHDQLMVLAYDDVRRGSGVYTSAGTRRTDTTESLQNWFVQAVKLAEKGDTDALEKSSLEFLDGITSSHILCAFAVDFFQLASGILLRKGQPVHEMDRMIPLACQTPKDATVSGVRELIQSASAVLANAEGSEESDLIRRVRHYIEEHIYDRLSRDQIAEQVYLSPDYLTRMFKREMGMSLVEYILERKVEHAKLLMDDHSVGDVAMMMGYDNFSYFSELFKRKTGMTPSQFKRRSEKP